MVARGVGPQGTSVTGGGGLVRVRNARVCKHFCGRDGTRGEGGEMGEITSCRGTVQSAWFRTSSEHKEGRSGCPQGLVVTTWTTVLTYPCRTARRVSVAVKRCARVTGKAGENCQNSISFWTRPLAPGCGDTLKASASYGSIQGANQGNLPRDRPVVLFCCQSVEAAQCAGRPT